MRRKYFLCSMGKYVCFLAEHHQQLSVVEKEKK